MKFKYIKRKGLRWGRAKKTYASTENRQLAGRLGIGMDVASVITKGATEQRLRGSLGVSYSVTLENRSAPFKASMAVRFRHGRRLQELPPMKSSPEQFTRRNPPKVSRYMRKDSRYPGF